VVDGLENAPMALNRLFDGDKMGKLMIKVADRA
jgi:NADPH-dependent curcumin reductase CurA